LVGVIPPQTRQEQAYNLSWWKVTIGFSNWIGSKFKGLTCWKDTNLQDVDVIELASRITNWSKVENVHKSKENIKKALTFKSKVNGFCPKLTFTLLEINETHPWKIKYL